MEGAPEFLIGTQSYTFDIKNEKDGKYGIMTFFTLPNGAANPDNKILARFAIPYEALEAMPNFIVDLIKRNDEELQRLSSNK